MANNKINQVAVAEELKSATKNTHTMVLALLFGNRINNPRALTKQHFELLDLDESYLDDWKASVKKFYTACANYFNAVYTLRADSKTCKKNRKEVVSKFNSLLADEIYYGTEDEIKLQALKITEDDVDFIIAKIVGFAKTDIGTFAILNGEEAFRKEVETYIGCKVAGATLMGEEDFATITAYKNAERAITTGEKRIKEATDDLQGFIKMVNALKSKSELSEEVENYFEEQIKIKKKEIADMKKRKSDNETYIAEHKKAYGELLNRLDNGRIDEFTGYVEMKTGENVKKLTFRERVEIARTDLDEIAKDGKEEEAKEEAKAEEKAEEAEENVVVEMTADEVKEVTVEDATEEK